MNPARLRNPVDPWTYRWSSHRAYLREKAKVRVDTDTVLEQLADKVGQARGAYVKFMQEGPGTGHEEKYYQAIDQRFLGDQTFVEKVSNKVKHKDIESRGSRVGFDRLIEAVAGEFALSKGSACRQWSTGRLGGGAKIFGLPGAKLERYDERGDRPTASTRSFDDQSTVSRL